MQCWGPMATRPVGPGPGAAVGARIRDVVGALSGFVVVFPALPSLFLVPLLLQLLDNFIFHRFLEECGEAFTEFVGWGRSMRVRFTVEMTCGGDEFVCGI